MSILDNIERSRVDVRSCERPDYRLSPVKYKYILVIPFWEKEMRERDVTDFVKDMSYLFYALETDYEVMLKSIIEGEYDKKIWTPFNDEELKCLFESKAAHLFENSFSNDYFGGLFVQFNIRKNTSYKKVFRLMVGLSNVLRIYEKMHMKHYRKPVVMYMNKNGKCWFECILSHIIPDMDPFIKIFDSDLSESDELIKLHYASAITEYACNNMINDYFPEYLKKHIIRIRNKHIEKENVAVG